MLTEHRYKELFSDQIELGNTNQNGEAGKVILFDRGNNNQAIITIDDGQLHVNDLNIDFFLRQLITLNTGRGPVDGDMVMYRASTDNLVWFSSGGGGGGIGSFAIGSTFVIGSSGGIGLFAIGSTFAIG